MDVSEHGCDLQEDVQRELNSGLLEHSLAAQNTSTLLCATEDISTALDEILTSKNSMINRILSATTATKCRQDRVIWIEHNLARALQCALFESNQTACDSFQECKQLSMLLQQQWEDKVLLEKQVQQICISVVGNVFFI